MNAGDAPPNHEPDRGEPTAGAGGQSMAPAGAASVPPFSRPPVWISAMVVCQEAFRDDKGRTHIHAVFDNLNATGFPVAAQFMVWCSVRGRGTARVVLKVVDTLDQSLAVTEPLIAEVTPFKAHEFFFGFNLQLAGAGLYRIQAFIDGIPATEVPLMVRFSPPAQQPAAGQR